MRTISTYRKSGRLFILREMACQQQLTTQQLTTSDESGMSWMTAKAELEIRVLGFRLQDGVSESAFSKCAQKASLR